MTSVISIVSQKGGTAKTTTSLNLGLALAETNRRVLVVDSDPQGAIGLSLKQDELAHEGLAEVLGEQRAPKDVVIKTKDERLSLLCRGRLDPADACEFETELYAGGRMGQIMAEISEGFDLILIDTPSGLGLPTRAALSCSDYVLVPLQAEPLAYRSVGQILRVIERVREGENPDLLLLGLVLTMVQKSDEVSLATMVSSWQELSGVFETMIPREPVFAKASEAGVPLSYLAGPTVPEAKRFSMLAEEVVDRIAQFQPESGQDHDRPLRTLL